MKSRLKLIAEAPKNKWGQKQGLYICSCGIEKIIQKYSVTTLVVKSCGCLNKESKPSHSITHGMRETRFYNIWSVMKGRCKRQVGSYKGIEVCDRWQEFYNFKDDMYGSYLEFAKIHNESNTTIDRINIYGNYEPSNCRWATYQDQCRNRSCTIRYAYQGQEKTLKEWGEVYSLPYLVLYKRLKIRGWNIQQALTTPVMSNINV